MTHHRLTQTTLVRTTWCALATLLAPSCGRLSTVILEWQYRRDIARGLSQLSSAKLRDIGLTRADVDAACTDSLDQPASLALTREANNRIGNW